ncbi:optineurin isoform X1 [Schistocerca serialis cubense]|uniref:optineurin isoform X1 n=1 Tax=Schistocerca serialis cubense TaxID=2023355 RepID=UPI00214F4574|nr:optineurin isoform X1 [Schistocerca serialis cubense]
MVKVNEKDETSKTPGHDPLSSMSSEGSFVVLGTSPHESERQPASDITIVSQPPSFNELMLTDYQTPSNLPEPLSADLSPEEVHKKLEEVVQHNLHLKELLFQNNLSWKRNYQILLTWQEELSKQQQKNNEKFAENKEFTMKLIAENKELKRYIEESKRGSDLELQLEAENAELKKKTAELEKRLAASSAKGEKTECGTPSKKELELSSLVEQLNKQLEAAERSKRQLIMDNERLSAQKSRLEKEMDNIKADLEELKVNCHKLELEREELLSRSNHLDESSTSPQLDVQSNEETDFATSMKNYERRLQQINTNLDEKTERYTTLDSWLQVAADNVNQWNGIPSADSAIIANLKKEIHDLRQLLIKEQSFGHDKKINLAEAQSQFQKLFSDYQELLEEWEKFHAEQKTKEKQNNEYHEFQVRGYVEKIDNLTAQLMSKEEALTQQKQRIDELTKEVKKLEQEKEEIPVLKAQAEVYQSDFIAEREARANLAGEKEKLAEDLRKLHRQNKELREELEKCRPDRGRLNSGWNTFSAPGRPRVNGQNQQQTSDVEDRQSIYNEEIPPRKKYDCPNCNRQFPRLDHLELHVETCLNLTN